MERLLQKRNIKRNNYLIICTVDEIVQISVGCKACLSHEWFCPREKVTLVHGCVKFKMLEGLAYSALKKSQWVYNP